MDSEQNRKRLERQARSLILSKDISLDDRDRINVLMRNQDITHEERYTAIIKILKKSPDKEIPDIEDEEEEEPETKKTPVLKKSPVNQPVKKPAAVPPQQGSYPDINGPTATKLYINDIELRFKKYKLFKKRYLVKRDTRLGFGFSKRLIPSKKFILLMNDIKSYQENILSRLPQILERILKDDSIESPVEFNYLRQLRRWMIVSPFTSIPYEKIKWMEQWDFERELKPFTVFFHSFLRVDSAVRDQVLALAERFLREEPDLVKEEIAGDEERSVSIRKENDNYRKEKYIFEYLGALRSFIAIHGEADSMLASFIKKKYEILTLEEALNIALEALVFQRPFTGTELREYFQIRPLSISNEAWDLSAARLKMYGKDPESRRRKLAEKLKRELAWYDNIYHFTKLDDGGRNLLIRSVEEQWKLVDRINRDAEDFVKNNFILFLEGVVEYFRNLMIPLLNGKNLMFDSYGTQTEGAVFSHDFFYEEIQEVEFLSSDIYGFRNMNPTLKVSREEIKKIVTGKISSMNHVESIVFKAGSVFYSLGSKLHEVYHNHLKAMEDQVKDGNKKENRKEMRMAPLEPEDRNSATCIPYSGCILTGFEPVNPLIKRIAGRKILSDTAKGGVIIFIIAYCYQVSDLCGYSQIQNDLGKRDIIRRQISELKGEDDDIKR